MRPLGIIGILVVVLGTVMFFGEGPFANRRDVVRLGNLKITATERHAAPPWAIGLVVATGVVLIAAGSRRLKLG